MRFLSVTMWGGLDDALGVSVKPKAPDFAPIPANEGTTVPEPPREREPFNLFGGFSFFGGLDGALGVSSAKPRAEDAADRPRPTPTPLRSTYTPGRLDTKADGLPPLVVSVHADIIRDVGRLAARLAPPTRSPSFLAVDPRGHGSTPVGDERPSPPRSPRTPPRAHPARVGKVVLAGTRWARARGARARTSRDWSATWSWRIWTRACPTARRISARREYGGFDYDRARAFRQNAASRRDSAVNQRRGRGTPAKARVDGLSRAGASSRRARRAVSLANHWGLPVRPRARVGGRAGGVFANRAVAGRRAPRTISARAGGSGNRARRRPGGRGSRTPRSSRTTACTTACFQERGTACTDSRRRMFERALREGRGRPLRSLCSKTCDVGPS